MRDTKTSKQPLDNLGAWRLFSALLLLSVFLFWGFLMPAQGSGSSPVSKPSIAQEVVQLSNQARASNRSRQVSSLNLLAKTAIRHSSHMLVNNYFNHYNNVPGIDTPLNRYRSSGGVDMVVAENIYQASGWPEEQIGGLAVKAFMNSPLHRKNLLNHEYNRIGVGVGFDGNKYMVTQMFAHQMIDIQKMLSKQIPGGVRIRLLGKVLEGNHSGAVFFTPKGSQKSKPVGKWSARNSQFQVDFDLPGSGQGQLAIGQSTGGANLTVNTKFSVPQAFLARANNR